MIVERQLIAGLENEVKFKTLIGYKLQNFAFFSDYVRLQTTNEGYVYSNFVASLA